MGSKLQSNAILKGYINSYCLICECYFDTDEETVGHIDEEAHTKRLSAHPYLEKYGDNHIRKVNKGYYCEFCGLLLATATKVNLHLQEKTHFDRKGTFLLRRPSGQASVLAFDDILIDEKAWHGLSEDTCAICNEEFSNENIHKTGTAHLLKLVQTKVEFAVGNNLYRKTDDSSFQCMTCNTVFVLKSLTDHFTNNEHKNLYTKCQDEYKKYMELCKSKTIEKPIKTEMNDANDKKSNTAIKPVATEVKEVKSHKKAIGTQTVIGNQMFDVKSQNDDAVASSTKKDRLKGENKNAAGTQTIIGNQMFDAKSQNDDAVASSTKKESLRVENPIVDKNQNNIGDLTTTSLDCDCTRNMQVARLNTEPEKTETVPNEKPEKEALLFANANNLTYNPGNTNAFCRICETKLPSTMRSMKEHVEGKEHKSKLAKWNQNAAQNYNRQRITKKPMNKFIEYCASVANMFHEDVVVNDKYCMSLASFTMMTPIGGRYRCQACEETVHEGDTGEHVDSPRHSRAMDITPVVTSLPDTEFVREVRPNIYHCGFCNQVVPRWDDVTKHLQCREHRENKDECKWRLQCHLPEVQRYRVDQLLSAKIRQFMGQLFRN